MAEPLKIGQRVEVSAKGVQGTVAFIGKTGFAQGSWIGLVLDEPKGKNNGSVKGQEYFKCEENYGMFVKENQVVALDQHGKPVPAREPPPSKIARSRQSMPNMKPKITTVRRKTSPQGSTLSASSSRMSLASSRHSLAGSRQSLSGSRQSLSGSRTHLESPTVDKQPDPNESQSQVPKRASFVETGFVETLKPQFTPGQAMTTAPTPVTSMDEKISNLQLQQELENRSQQIVDLGEKLDTLKIKRQEDKERLKNYEKLTIQLEQLVEFKSKIMSSQAMLQRELQKAKQDAKEAIEAKETHAEEVADLAEAVEMATLDKEMAEEKAETLQLELDVCREKLEEVTLDLEILKAEMQEKGTSISSAQEQLSAYELKQLHQQNARLRETVVRLRDLSAHEKHEYQKLLKDIDQKKSEITELGKTKEKLSTRVEEMEQMISDLQEQVDAALGAEEMVVILSDQKLTLEEKVAKLQEEVADLEVLQDMNDQLVDSNAELEADLREELDMAQAATREALRDRDAALETIADREQTISKFRQLVHQLQEQSLDLQHRLENETSKPVSALPEIIDFKKMFTETKAHIKAIDLELRRIDVTQLQQHIKFLSSYMPDSFMTRGGDHDAVLVILLIPRMIQKLEIVLGQVKDKFGAIEKKVDMNAVMKGHSINQYTFKCRISFYVYAIQIILHQYYYVLNTCKPEILLKVGATYPEMASQEKIIDDFIELLKRDQLDENISMETLEKCVNYFNTLFPVLFGPDAKLNHMQLLTDNAKCLTTITDSFVVDSAVIKCLMESSKGDMELLCQHVVTSSETLLQQLKLIKRRLPMDTNISNLGLNKEVHENLFQCYQHALKISKTLNDVVRTTIQTIVASGETEQGVTPDKVKDIAINASEKFYEQDDLGPVQSIKNSLNFIMTQITQLAQYLQDNEYEITTASKNEEKSVPPIRVRADSVKKELEQTKTLTSKLENKESDIKELKKLVKEKQEQLSEMTIRKELAEKKLGNVNKDYELTIEKLQRKLEEAHNNYKKKEKEFEETLDHLQTDIDSLESEKGEMKEKLKVMSKKAAMEFSKGIPGSQLPSLQSVGPTLPAVVRDSPLLMQEIDSLRKVFHQERNQRIKLENQKLKDMLDSMEPLPTFKSTPDSVLEGLFKQGAALQQEILMNLAKPTFPSIYKLKPGNGPAAWKRHFAEEQNKLLAFNKAKEEFQAKVAAEIVKRKVGGKVEADLATFPTKEMTKALNESKPVNVGFVKISKELLPPSENPKIVNLDLDFNSMQKILRTLVAK
ncbi:dynactin subunit 1 isoform X1 [Diabrotica virgifera virgifera]|uniref:Dynactin subunit 1 n=1 Tax=Diabrotica virgifera virgifera TaxID=50390 RepID=A0ABM5K8H0_DIAVI|nr:dynactin subunit 1 isoform X1 [Diabrotica virgifera virgifera]